jgi:hypothetical protein
MQNMKEDINKVAEILKISNWDFGNEEHKSQIN